MSINPFSVLVSLVALGCVGMMVLSSPAKPSFQEVAQQKPALSELGKLDPSRLDMEAAKASYAELNFDEIYVMPAGPKGLDFTPKTHALNGKKVRMEGYMVKHYHDDPAVFLFTQVPAVHNQVEYMLADSLPTSLMHVIMNVRPGDAPVWTPQRITIMGTLETGAHQEVDGRISHVRLRCDQVLDGRSGAPFELRRPLALQKDRMAYKAYQALNLSRLSGAESEKTSKEPRSTNPR
jgi:hypothetical protein